MPNLRIEDDNPGDVQPGSAQWWTQRGFDSRGSNGAVVCAECGAQVSTLTVDGTGEPYWRVHREWHDAHS